MNVVSFTVRNLPKPLHAALKKLALANRHSLNDEVVIAVEEHLAANATRKTALPIAKAISSATRRAVVRAQKIRTIELSAPKRAKEKR